MAEAQIYAVVETASGVVISTSLWDGEAEWSPPEGFIAVQADAVSTGWSYAAGIFTPPAVVPPTTNEILATNSAIQASLLASASQAMTPVLVSLQLGDATAEETASAKAWQAYTRALKEVDLTASDPTWPAVPA